MNDRIVKGELYCRLATIEKFYKRLLGQTYAAKGSVTLIRFLLGAIEILRARFQKYTIGQAKQLKLLMNELEKTCGYLLESRLTNVPWSIVPALDSVFQMVHKNHQFAICAFWTNNYCIVNEDAIGAYKKALSAPGLLWDDTDSVSKSAADKLFSDYPDPLYFVFFPKLERLSGLHFALLGHEIGHIFAKDWADSDFGVFVQKQTLENCLRSGSTSMPVPASRRQEMPR